MRGQARTTFLPEAVCEEVVAGEVLAVVVTAHVVNVNLDRQYGFSTNIIGFD